MIRILRVIGTAAVMLVLVAICGVLGQSAQGPPPRPAEKPPEYGCMFLDLKTSPNVVPDGTRIQDFLLTYRCKEKTRPVDIEIRNEEVRGSEPELVKIASDVVLEKGDHTLRLAEGGLAHGGRYITVLKASAPTGKKDILQRVDAAVCRGWQLRYVEKHLSVGGCDISLHTDPEPFKTGERIDRFNLGTDCKKPHRSTDIKISWQPLGGERPEARRELVKVATDVPLPAGPHMLHLVGGGVGREGHYVLEIEDLTLGSYFKTACTAWTLSEK